MVAPWHGRLVALLLLACSRMVSTLPSALLHNRFDGLNCHVSKPAPNDVWLPGDTYMIEWSWDPDTPRNGTLSGTPESNGTAMLEKLDSDGTSWERVVSQPAVPLNIYDKTGRAPIRLIPDGMLTAPITTVIVVATTDYPPQVICASAEFTVQPRDPVPPPEPSTPDNQQPNMPLWVWPVASVSILVMVVCCYGLVSCGKDPSDAPRHPTAGGFQIPGLHHQPLLDAADAHPIQPPNRPSLFAMTSPRVWRLTATSTLGSTLSPRGSEATSTLEYGTVLAGSGSPRGTASSPRGSIHSRTRDSLSLAARQSSFRARTDNRRSAFVAGGAVQWVRAMNPSGWIQWVRSDMLSSAEELAPPPNLQPGAVHWVRRVDVDGRAWLVRSDDMALVSDFDMIDKEEVAALTFERKIRWFRHELEQRLLPAHAAGGPVKFTIVRGEELRLMLQEFDNLEMNDMRRTFRFRVAGETDFFHDAGGVGREVYALVCRDLFSQELGLFKFSDIDNLTYCIDPAAGDSKEWLRLYRFAGRFLGKALVDGVTLSHAHLSAVLYKQLLHVPIALEDVQAIDSQVHASLQWMLENPINGILFETFSVETKDERTGAITTHELLPGGAEMEVTDENKPEYVEARVRWMTRTQVETQLSTFAQGFWEVVPQELISVFDFQELEMAICGLPQIDIADWKANVRYGAPFTEKHPVVQWFWEAVEAFTHDERARLLQFATGTSNVPVEGFRGLQSTRGKRCLFKLSPVTLETSQLPRAHTCFNTIDLPLFDSKEKVAETLRLVIDIEAMGFGLVE